MEVRIFCLMHIIVTLWTLVSVNGHGRLLEPPSRSSMWRKGFQTPKNYNDNSLFCGGFINEFLYQRGKCGVCGDPYQGPRDNEAGGKYATGVITRHYSPGQIINVDVEITANHMGWFEFKLCPNNNVNKKVTQECLDQHVLQLADAEGTKYSIGSRPGMFHLRVKLPDGLTCSQCVLQWKYHTGNSFGYAADGKGCIGCGNQEEFFGCSDISIGTGGSGNFGTQAPQTQRPNVVTPFPWVRPTQAPFVFPTQAPITQAPTQAPMVFPTQAPVKKCHAINNWSGIAYLDKWCNDRCRTGNCPSNACACN